MGFFRRKFFDDGEELAKKCHVCKNTQPRMEVWKLKDGRYICRTCRKKEELSKRQQYRSALRDYKKRDDYIQDDFNTDNNSRISDQEFDKLIEEFEEGNWSGSRNYTEYKKHEDYINFLFRVEFQRRRGTQSQSRNKPEQTYQKTRTTYYQILELGRDASLEEIKNAYKKLVIKWHPDKNKDDPILAESMFKKIREAYEILKDPEKKKQYDEQL